MISQPILAMVAVLQAHKGPVPSVYKNIVDHLITLILNERYDDVIEKRMKEIKLRQEGLTHE